MSHYLLDLIILEVLEVNLCSQFENTLKETASVYIQLVKSRVCGAVAEMPVS